MTIPPRKTTHQHLAEVSGLAEATYADWPRWKHTIPFPSPLVMGSSGTHQLETFLVVGSAWAQMLAHFLPSKARVLDIGCGCAKVARFLASDARVGSYIGFDPIEVCIEWNRRHVLPYTGDRFNFVHADLYSAEYNPYGRVDPGSFRFPADEESIDVAVASSLFTHLLEPTAVHYLRESARVLRPEGKLVLSLHTEPGEDSLYAGDEARIDVSIDYFLQLARGAGLALHEDLGSLCGQHALVLTPATA